MAPRLQVAPVQFREAVQPAEQVINTEYYSPEVKPASQLYELAGALRNFSNDIGGFMDKHEKQNDEAAALRGQAAALKANGADLAAGEAEGVRSGLFASFQSDKFVEGYKVTQGQIVGKKLASQFFSEYQQWDGRNNQDPTAFDTFLGEFINKNLQTDDPFILKGALPFLTEVSTQGYTVNQQDRSTALYNNSIDASIASSSLDIDNFVDRGIAAGGEVDYKGLWEVIQDQRSTALSTGVLAADYDKKMLDVIADKALETGDPALLSLLDNKVPGQAYTYATSPEGADTITKTLDTMSTQQEQRQRAAVLAQTAQDKKLLGEAQVTAINALIADPNHVFDEEFLKKAESLDPKFRLDLKQWGQNLAAAEPEDSSMILAIQSGIITGEFGLSDIVQEMGQDGVIHSQATATQMINLLNSQKDNANQPLLTNQTYKDSMSLLQRELAVKDPLFADPEGLSVAANAARLDYQRSMMAWFKQNPDADYSAIADQSGVVLKRVLEGVKPAGIGSTPEYATPASIADPLNPNPLAPTQEQAAAAAQATVDAATQAADPMTVWQGESPPAYDALSDDQRKKIDELARNLGETPDNYITQLWGNLRDSGTQPGPDASLQPQSLEGNTSPATGDATLSNIKYTYDATGFVEPKSNPQVSAVVLKKFGSRRLPVSIRNNNMGAVSITGSSLGIGQSWAAQQPGFVGVTPRPANEGGWYAKYATPEHGVGASSRLLERYGQQGVNTPLEIVTKWSTDTTAHGAYASTLVKFLKQAGFDVTKLSELDLSNANVRVAILKAKSAHESGAGVPVYSDEVFSNGAHYRFPAMPGNKPVTTAKA